MNWSSLTCGSTGSLGPGSVSMLLLNSLSQQYPIVYNENGLCITASFFPVGYAWWYWTSRPRWSCRSPCKSISLIFSLLHFVLYRNDPSLHLKKGKTKKCCPCNETKRVKVLSLEIVNKVRFKLQFSCISKKKKMGWALVCLKWSAFTFSLDSTITIHENILEVHVSVWQRIFGPFVSVNSLWPTPKPVSHTIDGHSKVTLQGTKMWIWTKVWICPYFHHKVIWACTYLLISITSWVGWGCVLITLGLIDSHIQGQVQMALNVFDESSSHCLCACLFFHRAPEESRVLKVHL